MESAELIQSSLGKHLEIELKEAVILALGSIRLPFTLNDAEEIFRMFSKPIQSHCLFKNLETNVFKRFLAKLEKAGFVQYNLEKTRNGIVHSISLTKKGINEYKFLRGKYQDTLIDESIGNIRRVFNIAS